MKNEKKMLKQQQKGKLESAKNSFKRRHKSTGRAGAKTIEVGDYNDVTFGKTAPQRSFTNDRNNVNKAATDKAELSVQFFGKSANLVNLRMH